MTQPSAIILFAAGLGRRMAPLTNDRPKPLIEVAGRALIDHALVYCNGLRTVVNTHYLSDQIIDHLADRDVSISHEVDQLLETGGGLKCALPLLNSNPVFTMNTDAVWQGENPIQALTDAWLPEMESLLLMIPRAAAIGHTGNGDFDIDSEGRLSRGTGFVYTGVQIIRTDRLSGIKKEAFSMWDLWTGMLDRGGMFGAVYDGAWCDVGRPDSIPTAEVMLKGNTNV